MCMKRHIPFFCLFTKIHFGQTMLMQKYIDEGKLKELIIVTLIHDIRERENIM